MFNRTSIIKRSALALATATAVLASAVPALAADDPSPAASASLDLGPLLSWTGISVHDEDGLAGRTLDIPQGLVELMESVGGNAAALQELKELLDRENGFAPNTGRDSSLGGAEDREDRLAQFKTESRKASFLEREEWADPMAGFGDPNEGDGRYNEMFGSGSGSRGSSGGGIRFGGPGSAADGTGTIIGDRQGLTSGDLWGIMEGTGDGGYVSVQADRNPDGGHTVDTTARTRDDGGYSIREVYDEDGKLVSTSYAGSKGTLVIHYGEDGEPTSGAYIPHWPDEESDPDEQPNPDGSDGTKQGCQWNPMYDRCWEDAWEVSREQKVSQPGGGSGTGDEPSHEGGFTASIQERINVVTQPSPEGGAPTGGGGGSDTGAPGGGGPCTVC